MIGRADFDLSRHAADNFLRARHALWAGRVDVNGTVVVDINLGAGLGDDALDGFAARPNERADLLRINFDRLDAGRVLAEIRARLVDRLRHDAENFRARFLGTERRFSHDLVAHAGQFQGEVGTADALVGPAKFV